MKKASGFMLYDDALLAMSLMSDEDAGRLIKLLAAYFQFGAMPDPETLSENLNRAFLTMKGGIDRGSVKYRKTCRKNAYSGHCSAAKKGLLPLISREEFYAEYSRSDPDLAADFSDR